MLSLGSGPTWAVTHNGLGDPSSKTTRNPGARDGMGDTKHESAFLLVLQAGMSEVLNRTCQNCLQGREEGRKLGRKGGK